MGLARNALLWISENRKLRQALPQYAFIRRAVSRFMPGEELSDALAAAEQLKTKSINSVFTRLGENVADEHEARKDAVDYVAALQQIQRRGLDTHVSVKLTHLGLDLNEKACIDNLTTIVSEAKAVGNVVWIDMEQSQYVDRTIDIYKTVRKEYPNVGICLQAYLYRTANDVQELLPYAPAIRFVKGAYKEPQSIAFKKKSDVDVNFFNLATTLMHNVKSGAKVVVGTHDTKLIQSIQAKADELGLAKKDYEFHLLYGIQTSVQQRLAREGFGIRVLISYGNFWFPWYVRRLAERPANVWFVMRKMFTS
jgi:proline dehydrogenase